MFNSESWESSIEERVHGNIQSTVLSGLISLILFYTTPPGPQFPILSFGLFFAYRREIFVFIYIIYLTISHIIQFCILEKEMKTCKKEYLLFILDFYTIEYRIYTGRPINTWNRTVNVKLKE